MNQSKKTIQIQLPSLNQFFWINKILVFWLVSHSQLDSYALIQRGKMTFKVDYSLVWHEFKFKCEFKRVSAPLYATTLEQNQMDVHHAGNFPQQLHEQQFPLAYCVRLVSAPKNIVASDALT